MSSWWWKARRPLVARRKSKIAGIWINTKSVRFASLPTFYGIVSTRPVEEIASPAVLAEHEIGFEHVRMKPAGHKANVTPDELADFKAAVIRLKQRERLYARDEYGVIFIGRSLFRSSIDLPANVPVGQLGPRLPVPRWMTPPAPIRPVSAWRARASSGSSTTSPTGPRSSMASSRCSSRPRRACSPPPCSGAAREAPARSPQSSRRRRVATG